MIIIKTKHRILTLGIVVITLLLIAVSCSEATQPTGEPLPKLSQIEPFTLESTTGETYESTNDKIKLISFIFINCPDGVCPMTMYDFHDLQTELQEKGWFGKEVELLAITFDPERDTLEALREYSESFSPDPSGWHFLRGTEEEIQAIAEDLNYVYKINEDGSGIHSTNMILVDADHYIRTYHWMNRAGEPIDQETIIEHMDQLIRE